MRGAGLSHSAAPVALPDSFLRDAGAHCRKRGARLTRNRAEVLCLIAASPVPLKAYGILAALRARRAAAPAMVYRSLEFLGGHHLVHRLLTVNAYFACTDASLWSADTAFLVCTECMRTEAMAGASSSTPVDSFAHAAGFRMTGRVLEASGVCASCQVSDMPARRSRRG